MIPLAKPASRFQGVRLPIILLRSIASGSPLKSAAKFWQQSMPVISDSCLELSLRINDT